MDDRFDDQERPQKTSVVPEYTVRRRIESLLATPGPLNVAGGYWWTLAEIQQRIFASSVRSRLQDIMQDDRARPEAERLYDQAEAKSDRTGARFNIYRRRVGGSQRTLFDVPASNPWGA